MLIPAALVGGVVLMGVIGGLAENGQRSDTDIERDRPEQIENPTVAADTEPTDAAASDPEPTIEPEPGPEPPVELSGAGNANTDPFTLAGGDYRTTATVTADCFYSSCCSTHRVSDPQRM